MDSRKNIYTKTGDSGFASTMNRKMIPKNSPIFCVLGTIDELNSTLGVAREKMPEATGEIVRSLQKDLIAFSAELAGGSRFATKEKVAALEESIDTIMKSVPEIKEFITPGDTEAGAALDVSRSVARRAERELVSSKQTGGISREAMMWMNRISDFIYALARLMDAELASQQGQKPVAVQAAAAPAAPMQLAVGNVAPMPANSDFLDVSLWLCRAVLDKAKEMHLPVVTAACDAGGNPTALMRADGAYIASVDIAQSKAFTSVSVQMSTEKLGALCQPNGPLYGIQNTNQGRIVIFGGGIPLYRNGVLIGGFGVSGGSAEQDTGLAHYAEEIYKKQL